MRPATGFTRRQDPVTHVGCANKKFYETSGKLSSCPKDPNISFDRCMAPAVLSSDRSPHPSLAIAAPGHQGSVSTDACRVPPAVRPRWGNPKPCSSERGSLLPSRRCAVRAPYVTCSLMDKMNCVGRCACVNTRTTYVLTHFSKMDWRGRPAGVGREHGTQFAVSVRGAQAGCEAILVGRMRSLSVRACPDMERDTGKISLPTERGDLEQCVRDNPFRMESAFSHC